MISLALRKSLVALTAGLVWFASAPAFAQQADDTYARYYGDGLRHYAEGDFAEAVENLYRAYALQAKASTMGLIVSSYDKMGFCDAAERQLNVHRMVHAEAKAPQLDRCKTTGKVSIACEGPEAAVTVDRRFDVSCGQDVSLPIGEHKITAARISAPKKVTVRADKTAAVELVFSPAPKRWKTAENQPDVSKLGDDGPNVERIAQRGYAVFESSDGLYHIYIHPGAEGGRGRVLQVSGRPKVLRLCDPGESFDRENGRCVQVQGMQIQKME